MKQVNSIFSVLALTLVMGCGESKKHEESTAAVPDTSAAPAVAAESTKPEAEPVKMDSAAMMKAWQEYMTPGPMHKWMASTEGKWEAEVRSAPAPGAPLGPPQKAKVEHKMVMNGLYQQSSFKGDMMGMPFEGMGTMAYDNARKKFMSTWIDNMSSSIMYMEGDYNPDTKTLEMKGKSTDLSSPDKMCEMREVNKMVDDKTMTMEMYAASGGQPEYKMMEITMKKK